MHKCLVCNYKSNNKNSLHKHLRTNKHYVSKDNQKNQLQVLLKEQLVLKEQLARFDEKIKSMELIIKDKDNEIKRREEFHNSMIQLLTSENDFKKHLITEAYQMLRTMVEACDHAIRRSVTPVYVERRNTREEYINNDDEDEYEENDSEENLMQEKMENLSYYN